MKKKRKILVILFLIIYAIYLYISLRGEYLQILGTGKNYLDVFSQNLRYKTIVIVSNFILVFLATYITTVFIKKGLQKFFLEEKKEMPKLPNKSISLVFGVLISMFTSSLFVEKVTLAFNSTWFGIKDPAFGFDIGFYVFQKPLIEIILYYLIGLTMFLTLYIAIYYIFAFNKYFGQGISVETLKRNTFMKQLLTNVIFVVIIIAILTLINVQNVVLNNFIDIKDGTSLCGAGLIDITIRTWGYRIFAIVIIVSVILAAIRIKNQSFKKVIIPILIIPAYLVLFFIVMVGFDLIYVNNNELDKEKQYISENIKCTKNAYNLNIEEVQIENNTENATETILNNNEVINNINILNEETVLASLKEYQTNSGYYNFKSANESMYKINGENKLLYLAAREIVSNDSRTYKNRTFEYTHGYGITLASAANTDEKGNVEYLQSGFDKSGEILNTSEERIYFGQETNNAIIVNENIEEEYDYPLTNSTNSTNSYKGEAGLKLNFLDRLILAINEGNLGIAFSNKNTDNSKIITKRNIIDRAKEVMPYLIYDENPYLVSTEDGNLVWVLEAYTVTNNYPYSQKTLIEIEGEKKEINYIRNSVKVIIDAYDGTIDFYITDKTDPIIIAYRNLYPSLFKDGEEGLPSNIKEHIVYPEYLYKIQADILKMYHNVQADILYRADDIWDIAKENTTSLSTVSGSYIKPYYTVVKTIDNQNNELAIVVPYTISEKQNIISYLVGTKNGLKLYKYLSNSAVLGTMQLDKLLEEDETISAELKKLDVSGSKIIKNTVVVPINDTLLYVVPIYQVKLNEKNQVPVLKKVIIAYSNKIAMGDNMQEAVKNLISQETVSFEVKTTDSVEGLISEIINANKNLKESNQSNNWELIGKDLANLQDLINNLEQVVIQEESTKVENKINENVLVED